MNNKLQERIEEMNLLTENLHKQLKSKDVQFGRNLKYLLQHFSMKSEFEVKTLIAKPNIKYVPDICLFI